MENKKALIITYYWPPAGGAGIQRVLKLVKYLSDFDWTPIVLTVKNGDYPVLDHTFEQEIPSGTKVVRSRILEPHKIFKRLRPKSNRQKAIDAYIISQKGGSWLDRLGRFVRLNVFIPDARIGWYPTAIAAGSKIIREEKPDVIFTTSPPHSLQLIARRLSNKYGLPVVADFRDPWLEIVYYQSVRRSKLALAIDGKLEKKVLKSADAVTTISDEIIQLFRTKADLKYAVKIPNGYDPADFENLPNKSPDVFTITYTGVLSRERVPYTLIRCLSNLLQTQKISDLRLRIVGKMCQEFSELMAEHALLSEYVEFISYVPHKEALKYLRQSFALLLVIDRVDDNQGFLSGKVFDYIGAKKPILGIGPVTGEAHKMLRASDCGRMVDYDDVPGTTQFIMDLYRAYKSKEQAFTFSGREKFSRVKIAQDMAAVFDRVSNRKES